MGAKSNPQTRQLWRAARDREQSAAAALAAAELAAQAKWDAAPNVFIAYQQYRADSAQRRPVIQEWVEALAERDKYARRLGIKKGDDSESQ